MKCLRCGKEFEPTNNKNTYCMDCRAEHKKEYLQAWRQGKVQKKEMREVKCAICGKVFMSSRFDAKYCGNECYNTGRKAIAREWQKKRYAELKKEREQVKESTKKPNYMKRNPAISQLSMIQREAEKLNMSYGQYVALYGNNKEFS